MGRFLMYTTIALLAVCVLSSFLILKHGSEGLGQVQGLTVDKLTSPASANAYNGATVSVTGTLVYNNDLKTFELTGKGSNYPLPIQGLADDVLAPLNNQDVTVSGKFVYEQDKGTHLEAKTIHLTNSPSATPEATGI